MWSTRPFSRTTMRSYLMAVSKRWSTDTTVIFGSRCLMTLAILSSVSESRLEVNRFQLAL